MSAPGRPDSLTPAGEIVAAQADIVDTFKIFEDWTERYQYIIDLGRQAPAFPEEWKVDKYKLHGCQSQVWIVTERRGDRLHYSATSDSASGRSTYFETNITSLPSSEQCPHLCLSPA